jgi:hypothetical protein
MPSEGTDDGEDDPKTYRDYKRAKNDRLKDPEDAGPRDPAEGFEGVGEDVGFEDVLEGDGDVSKSTQEELEDALADANFYGINGPRRPEDGVEKAEDGDSLTPTKAEIERELNPPQESEEDLLRDIRGQLHALNRQAEFGSSGGGSGVSKSGNAVELLETIEDELERQEPGEEQAELLEDALNAYVEASPENGLEDPLRDVLAWVAEQAEDMNPDERGRVMDTLDRLETATDASGAGAAD